jgi:TetR/AcrR family transcriptional repressor of nem operon
MSTTRLANKQDTKIALLEAGMDIMLEKGYSNTGIQEVLSSLGVPKGSFYHFFESKENFAVEIIHHYDQTYTAELLKTLRNSQESPLQRLKSYCETGKQNFLSRKCRKGCLIGNLSQEMSDQSEVLRRELSTVMAKWRDLFAQCIAEGQKLGEVTKVGSASELAEFFNAAWGGAVMRAKTVKNTEPLESFIELMFEHFLRA